jgi:hypothetical protein
VIPGRAELARAAARARFGRTPSQRHKEALEGEFGGGSDARRAGPDDRPAASGGA